MSVTPCPKLDFLLSPDRYPNDSWERTLVDTRKDRKKGGILMGSRARRIAELKEEEPDALMET
jgi:hypothetical protein